MFTHKLRPLGSRPWLKGKPRRFSEAVDRRGRGMLHAYFAIVFFFFYCLFFYGCLCFDFVLEIASTGWIRVAGH